MKEIVLKNAREKFQAARRSNENFSDEVYDICEYLAEVIPDDVTPKQLGNYLIILKYDLISGFDHTLRKRHAEEIFKKLCTNHHQIISQIQYIPQVVDMIADDKFVRKFREYCKVEAGINPPVVRRFENSDDYPEYVEVAANWWTLAIQSPKLDIGEPDFSEYMAILSKTGSVRFSMVTDSDLESFHRELEYVIYDSVLRNGSCRLYVDYEPMLELAKAAKVINKKSLVTFPFKTCMDVEEDMIYVRTCSGRKKIYG